MIPPIQYFDLYTLDFSHVRDFAEQVVLCDDNDPLKQPFKDACNGAALLMTLKQHERQLGMLTTAIPDCLTNTEEFSHEFATQLQTAQVLTRGLFDQCSGSDPYTLQDLVHKALGFDADTDGSRYQHYLKLMQNTGFLIASGNPHSVDTLAASYLATHPDVYTLSLGCGKAAFSGPACCHFRRADNHATESFKIALDAIIGPDLVTNMHNPELWAGIPDGRFSAIFDHSYGNFLFEDPRAHETLQELFRVLTPYGYLEFDFTYTDAQIEQLTQVGFIVDPNSKIARKVLI